MTSMHNTWSNLQTHPGIVGYLVATDYCLNFSTMTKFGKHSKQNIAVTVRLVVEENTTLVNRVYTRQGFTAGKQ